MKEGDLVRHLMDGQTGIIVLAWGVMDVVEAVSYTHLTLPTNA